MPHRPARAARRRETHSRTGRPAANATFWFVGDQDVTFGRHATRPGRVLAAQCSEGAYDRCEMSDESAAPKPSRAGDSAASRVAEIVAAAEQAAETLRAEAERRAHERIAEAERAAELRVRA